MTTPAQMARAAADEVREAADYVRLVAEKLNNLRVGMPDEEEIPDYYARLNDEDIASKETAANRFEKLADEAALEAEEAEAAGDATAAQAAAQRGRVTCDQMGQLRSDVDEMLMTAETDHDELDGPSDDDELSDPENPLGIRDD